MQDSVNQAEQEALLGGPQGPAQEQPSDRPDPRPFNFNQQPRHNKAQLRSLRLLHENFCAPLAKALGAAAGLPCSVRLEGLAPEKPAQSEAFVYASASADSGKILFALARPAAWLLLERLLGGCGGGEQPAARPHSGIEKRVLSQLLLKPVLAAYGETWGRIAPVSFSFERFEDEIAVLPGFSPAAESVAARFSVKLGETAGELAVLLPFPFLKPLMPELDMTKILGFGQGQVQGQAAPGEARLGIEVGLKVILGRIDLKLKDLNSLLPGDVLRLDARPDEEIIVEIEGQPRFAGKAGCIGKGLGVQITKELEHTQNGKEK